MTCMKIKIEHLSLAFKQGNDYIEAINDLSFSIDAGKTFALLGESGCGKSLTASAIMQLLPMNARCHESSKIYFEQENLLALSENQMRAYRGVKISMIFQEPMTSLNPVLSIGYQLIEVLSKQEAGLTKAVLRAQAIALLEKVEIPEAHRRIDDYPHQLSGGQKQRVMIAIAIASKPDLLIADEPTTALDVTIQAQILSLLKKLTQELGTAMLLITHDLSVVRLMADNIGVMYAGQLVESCDRQTFFSKAKHPYSRRLLACLPTLAKRGQALKPIEGRVPSLDEMPQGCRFRTRCEHAQEKCTSMPLLQANNKHQIRCHFLALPKNNVSASKQQEVKANKTDTETMLKVSHLKIHFPIYQGVLKRQIGNVKAVDDVSFSLFKGQTLALVGESGCGKTTLSRGICQLIPISSGEIYLQNKLLNHRAKSLAAKLQIVFQDPFSSMNPRMLVQDILLEGVRAQVKTLSLREQTTKTEKLLDMVGLPANSANRYPHEFSGGQRQRISIARALAVNPSIILCDEPTSALDVSVQAQVLNLLLDLQTELGLSYLFISHDLAVVSYMADHIMVMNQGKIIEQGEAARLLNAPKSSYTKTLLAASMT